MEILTNNIVRISYNDENDYIHFEWETDPAKLEFKDALNRGINLLEATNATKWLADHTRLGNIHIAEQHWMAEQWFPRLALAGIVKMAIITGDNKLHKACMLHILAKVQEEGITCECFTDKEIAMNWLIQ